MNWLKKFKMKSESKLQAVILAAGKSTRTYPLTLTRPKPLLKVLDKTILEHNLEALTGIVNQVILIVGYKQDMIKKAIGTKYKNINIKYITQKQQLGTGHAVKLAEKHIKDRFIIFGGDDLFSKKDIQNCIKHKYCILAQKTKTPKRFGILQIKDNSLVKIEEKPSKPKSNLANTALYVLDKNIFNTKIKKSKRGEIEFTDFVNKFAKKEKIKIVEVKDYWLPISYPWSYLEANVFLLNRIKRSIKGRREKKVTIKGKVHIGKHTVIKAGSYLEGPIYIGENCEIGPFAHIRPDTIIQDNCRIGKSELVDSVIMQGTTCKHKAYIGHSVIGEKVNIGAGLITADYRHDGKNHITLVNKKKIDTLRRKLGAFIGDNVNTGIGTLIYPGRKIFPNKTTLPGEVVKKDVD